MNALLNPALTGIPLWGGGGAPWGALPHLIAPTHPFKPLHTHVSAAWTVQYKPISNNAHCIVQCT